MIEITPTLFLDEREVRFEFTRASGPGGQNVNKVATSVQLRFDYQASTSLPPDVKQRLAQQAHHRINEQGVLVIEAHRFRSQAKNRQDALDRLVTLIRRAFDVPRKRKKTQPTLASKQRRLADKKQRSEIKRARRNFEAE